MWVRYDAPRSRVEANIPSAHDSTHRPARSHRSIGAPGVPAHRSAMTARTAEPRDDLEQRLRSAFVQGAEEDSRRRLGRGLTQGELERVLRRYPGNALSR
jgi:hypothetical protein